MNIVFDIGGTNLRIANSHDGQNLEKIITKPTPQNYSEGLATLIESIEELSDGGLTKISGGIPGILNEDKTMLTQARHLQDWVNKPFAKNLEEKFNVPVKLENDTALGALGEANFGAGKDYARVMYMSIGTGFGGAWVINKQLVSGKFGFEPGHQIINFEKTTELEEQVSGNSLIAKYGSDLSKVADDEIWETIKSPLATGLFNTFLHWPSDIIVLGGGVMLNHPPSKEQLNDTLSHFDKIYPFKPIITLSNLNGNTGLFGALTL